MRGAGSDGGAGRPAVRGAWSGGALGAAAGCVDGRRGEGRERGVVDASWIPDFGEQGWHHVSGARMFPSASRVV